MHKQSYNEIKQEIIILDLKQNNLIKNIDFLVNGERGRRNNDQLWKRIFEIKKRIQILNRRLIKTAFETD